ncbi:MAG: hypothetical protein CYPHOPRED_001711 [Cyphobasidiales sp. Tagirdzhanova-0007]|nr:MAG: hypothetical protein CYPHOPRED_001711 [Cyphobasidiales sp. Tagirdzhanova-0007]
MDSGYAVGGQALVLTGLNRGLFNMEERTTPENLQVSGRFPQWLSGVLYRIGPAKFSIPLDKPVNGEATYEIKHWFDGLAQVHRFEFDDGQVIHRSKDTSEELREYIKQNGNYRDSKSVPNEQEEYPSLDFFAGKVDLTGMKSRQNVNVTISRDFPMPPTELSTASKTIVAKTDTIVLQLLDEETLEPLEQFDYSRFDKRLDGHLAASHAVHFDGALYNYIMNIAQSKPQYHVFELRESGVRILATTSDIPPTYMHSLQATHRYISESPFTFLTLWDAELIPWKMAWHGYFYPGIKPPTGKKTTFCLFDRIKGGFVAKFEGPNFFAFHTINSYDDPDDNSVVIDLATVTDWHTMDHMYLDNMRSGNHCGSLATRFRLPAIPDGYKLEDPPLEAHLEHQRPQEANIELMTSNPAYHHRPYRYTYGCNHQKSVPVAFSRVIKLDMSDPDSRPQYWSPHGTSSISEPVFVPRPGATREDDGILLTVVMGEDSETSSIVALDATTMEELASADVGLTVPPGFHGSFDAKL